MENLNSERHNEEEVAEINAYPGTSSPRDKKHQRFQTLIKVKEDGLDDQEQVNRYNDKSHRASRCLGGGADDLR